MLCHNVLLHLAGMHWILVEIDWELMHHGHCPPEKLHSIHEGMMHYLILLFLVKFGTVTSAQGLKIEPLLIHYS